MEPLTLWITHVIMHTPSLIVLMQTSQFFLQIFHVLWDVIEMWWTGHSFHASICFCEKGGQTVCAFALHLNLDLTGDCAFLLSPQKTHSVWFISVLNYGDMGQCPEKSPSSYHTHVNIQIHVLICHKNARTHTLSHTLSLTCTHCQTLSSSTCVSLHLCAHIWSVLFPIIS